MISEFTYGEAGYVTNSVYHQPIMYDGKEVGVLRTSDINLLAPLVGGSILSVSVITMKHWLMCRITWTKYCICWNMVITIDFKI